MECANSERTGNNGHHGLGAGIARHLTVIKSCRRPTDRQHRPPETERGDTRTRRCWPRTIVTERYRTQYALLYTTRVREAVTDKEIQLQEWNAFHNPAVSMSTVEMTRFARRIWNSPAKIRNIATKAHRMTMRLNNIYSVGEYFFIDFSIENQTNIRFDIDEIRVKLADKKTTKATNAQVIELTPGTSAGGEQDVPARLPECGCGQENDVSERQSADHRDDRENRSAGVTLA